MKTLADLAGPHARPACWDAPELFAAPALDYDPKAEEYRALDEDTRASLAEEKALAEEAAVDTCFGCALMVACEEIDKANDSNPRSAFVSGVIGGRTDAERRARRVGRSTATKTTSIPNPQIAPGDRGPRNQVDDELVARLSLAGRTSAQIAHELDCSPRTVSRARKRMGIGATLTRPQAAKTSPATTLDAFAQHAAAQTAQNLTETARTAQATRAAIVTATKTTTATTTKGTATSTATSAPVSNPFIGGRPVSPAMEAVYNHLVTVGGSDTLDTLIEVAAAHVTDAEALDWWTKHNTVTIDGQRTLRPAKATLPTPDRVREGARAKVFNSISATHRKGRYLDRRDDTFTFKPEAAAAWRQRMNALVAA